MTRTIACVLLAALFVANVAAFDYGFPDCVKGPLAKFPVCDISLGFRARAVDLISRLNVTEKIANMGDTSPGVPRLGLPPYEWWSEGLHGVAYSPGVNFAPAGSDFSYATSFPTPIGLGAAFHDELIYLIGSVVSTEGRAFNNVQRAGLDYWTPNINPFKDPRWGRGQETPGEDPFHLASYVYQLISGLQEGEDTRYRKVVADCKHFAAYDLENWDGVDRDHFNAIVSEQDMVEYYLPSFESCIRDAHVGSIMCSYNAVNGVPNCANSFLLNDIARGHWHMDRYEGWVTSDCGAIYDIYNTHHYTATPEGAAAVALLGGTDVNCGGWYAQYLQQALTEKLINETDIDRALIRQYSSLIQLGYFDPAANQPYRGYTWKDVNTDHAQQLALQAALESIVLIKNDGTLPLSTYKTTFALIGPWANATNDMQGNYFGSAPYLISAVEAFNTAKLAFTYAKGCNISDSDQSHFNEAIAAAKSADFVIFFGGINNNIESEGTDRTTIVWPGVQLPLIQALEATGKPIVIVQYGGGQVDDSYLKTSKTVNSIIWAGYPGQSGGTAVMQVLTGAYAPAGRLPVTQYPANYVNQVTMFEMGLRPNGTTNPGRTYKWYNNAVYPFGHGIHYTTFELKWSTSQSAKKVLNIQDLIEVGTLSHGVEDLDKAKLTDYTVAITNTGKVTSDYVAMLYVNGTAMPPVGPYRELIGYDRAPMIAPGQTVTVYFTLTLKSLSKVDENGHRWLHPGLYRIFSDHDAQIESILELTGDSQIIHKWPQNPARFPKAKLAEV